MHAETRHMKFWLDVTSSWTETSDLCKDRKFLDKMSGIWRLLSCRM